MSKSRISIYAGTSSDSFEPANNGSFFKPRQTSTMSPEQRQKQGDNQQETHGQISSPRASVSLNPANFCPCFAFCLLEKQRKSKGGGGKVALGKAKNIHFFIQWFIGFVEGDGCFYVSGVKPIFSIHLHIKDLELLREIRGNLNNIGSIYANPRTNKALFSVKARSHILFLIHLFNGRLFLMKKQNRFIRWVRSYNAHNNADVQLEPFHFRPSLKDAWISGFTDAEGCFTFSFLKRRGKITNQMIQRYILCQKESQGELLYLRSLLNGYVEKGTRCDRLVVNYLQLDAIICYLNHFPLKSSKAQSFYRWKALWRYRNEFSPNFRQTFAKSSPNLKKNNIEWIKLLLKSKLQAAS